MLQQERELARCLDANARDEVLAVDASRAVGAIKSPPIEHVEEAANDLPLLGGEVAGVDEPAGSERVAAEGREAVDVTVIGELLVMVGARAGAASAAADVVLGRTGSGGCGRVSADAAAAAAPKEQEAFPEDLVLRAQDLEARRVELPGVGHAHKRSSRRRRDRPVVVEESVARRVEVEAAAAAQDSVHLLPRPPHRPDGLVERRCVSGCARRGELRKCAQHGGAVAKHDAGERHAAKVLVVLLRRAAEAAEGEEGRKRARHRRRRRSRRHRRRGQAEGR